MRQIATGTTVDSYQKQNGRFQCVYLYNGFSLYKVFQSSAFHVTVVPFVIAFLFSFNEEVQLHWLKISREVFRYVSSNF